MPYTGPEANQRRRPNRLGDARLALDGTTTINAGGPAAAHGGPTGTIGTGRGGSVDPAVSGTIDTSPPPPASGGGSRDDGNWMDNIGDQRDVMEDTSTVPATPVDELPGDFIEQQIRAGMGPVDIGADVANMQGETDRLLGSALMDQRASAGASGFGESGALMALEGNTRADAARRLAMQESDLRDREQQQAITGAENALGLDIEQQQAAADSFLLEQILAMLGGEAPPPAAPAPSGGGNPNEAFDNATGRNAEVNDTELHPIDQPGDSAPEDYAGAQTEADAMPSAGYEFVRNNPDGTSTWARDGVEVTAQGHR